MTSLLDKLNMGDDDDSSLDEMPTLLSQSLYYTTNDVTNLLNSKNNSISIYSLNCQSLQSKFDQLNIYVQTFKDADNPFSIICLQESWLKLNHDISLLEIDGYSFIHVPSSCSTHGGVAMYIRNDIEYSILNINGRNDIWDALFIEISINMEDKERKIIIGNIYRPPRNNVDNYKVFINDLDQLLTSFSNSKDVVLVGDYNIDLLKINENSHIKDYFDTIISNSFIPKITMPTRVTETSATLIDNCFIKTNNFFTETKAGIIYNKISDHYPYFIKLTLKNNIFSRKKQIKCYTNSPQAMINFKNEISKISLNRDFEHSVNGDPNQNYNKLDSILKTALNKHLPAKMVNFKKYKYKKNPWMTQGIMRSIKFRDDLYKKLKDTDRSLEIYNTYKINLQTYNRILKQNIRQAKKSYYYECFHKFQRDIKKTWMTIKDILNKSTKKDQFPKFFMVNDIKLDDPRDIANGFNKYFVEIGPKLANSIAPLPNKSFTDYLKKPVTKNFTFMNVTDKQIVEIIDSLKPKSSCGIDRISNKLIKTIKHEISKPLALIINQCFTTGVFPEKLKIARVLPIYKKNDNTVFDNYRPVSILPSLSKIFEKVIFNQLYKYFNDNHLFFDSQYGFRTKHSTELAALELIDIIVTKMDQNEVPINIYIDLSKAFDTLDHEILIHKLQFYGLKDKSLQLLKDYLTNRQQYVEFNETMSDYCNIETGVPQGSILGPLLFIIYLNDLEKASTKFHPVIYADDTALSTTLNAFNSKNSKNININQEIDKVNIWFKLNKLSINPTKTKAMLFYTPQRNVVPVDLFINDSPIEYVNHFNYLGIVLDSHLSWKFHIENVSNKIARTIGIMCKLKNYLPLNTLVTLYNTLILPYLSYGLLAWGLQSNKLENLQKKAIRTVTASKYNAHTEPLFKKLKILKVTDLCNLQEMKFIFKLENKMLPAYFTKSMNIRQSDIHNHNTRNANELINPTRIHSFANNSVRFRISKIRRDTSDEIKNLIPTHGLDFFIKFVKNTYLNKYRFECFIANCPICPRN